MKDNVFDKLVKRHEDKKDAIEAQRDKERNEKEQERNKKLDSLNSKMLGNDVRKLEVRLGAMCDKYGCSPEEKQFYVSQGKEYYTQHALRINGAYGPLDGLATRVQNIPEKSKTCKLLEQLLQEKRSEKQGGLESVE